MFETYYMNYLNEFAQTSKPGWSYETSFVLLGAKEMYEASGQDYYYNRIAECMEHYVPEDGSLDDLGTEGLAFDKISAGKVLSYLYEKTGEEKYKIALEVCMQALRQHFGISESNLSYGQANYKKMSPEDAYIGLPLYLEYETKYNEKENYNDVYMRMRAARSLFDDEKLSLRCRAYDLMALIDMYENSSEEVFEQHKQYAVWFKEALREILSQQYEEAQKTAIISYCILKGCRLGILQKEKYQYIGEKIIQNILEQNFAEAETVQEIGAIALAYAEFLRRSEVL